MTARLAIALLLLASGCHLLIAHGPSSSDRASDARPTRETSALRDGPLDRAPALEPPAVDARAHDLVGMDKGPKPDQAKDAKGKDLTKDGVLDLDGGKDSGPGGALQPVCDPSLGWCWDHPLPQGNTLHGVWGTSASNLYAVGDGRSILRWDGVSWSRMTTAQAALIFYAVFGVGGTVVAGGTNGTLLELSGSAWIMGPPSSLANYKTIRAIWGTSSSNLYAVGDAGTVLHRSSSGWGTTSVPTSQRLLAVWGSSASDVYVGGEGPTLLHWNGSAWESIDTGGLTAPITAIGGTGPTEVYVGAASGIHKVASKTVSSALQSFSVNAIFAQGSALVAVGGSGKMAVKNGTSWGSVSSIPSAQGRELHAGWASGSDRVMVGHAGVIVRHDGASYYLNVYQALKTEVIRGAWRSSSGELYVVGGHSQGFLLKRDANGAWSEINLGSVPPLHAIWGKSSGLYLAGDKGTAIFYNWNTPTSLNIQTSVDLRGVWCPQSSAQVYFVGKGGLAKKLDGIIWSTVDLGGVTADLNAVWGRDASNIYIAGDATTAFFYDGAIAKPISAPGATASLRGVWADGYGNATFVGSGGTILRWPGSGNAALATSVTAQTLNAVTGDPVTGVVHAVGDLGAYVTGAGTLSSIPTLFGGHLHAVVTGSNGTFALGANGAVLRR